MILSRNQIKQLKASVKAGLQSLYRPPLLTAVEWADSHFYMSTESSYQEGRWETLPFQVAILNAMGNDRIKTVNFIKSARVGYTKLLMAATGYLCEHKKRNILLFQPTDSDAENFMKSHVESAIRDIPVWLKLAPWLGRKHRDNTLSSKRFSNGKKLYVVGGAAARNYREKSVDTVMYDELAAFDPDVEKEGSPTFLGDKRFEGSVFPKSIRGSTPKIRGECQIEKAAQESNHDFYFYVPCPHCGEFQRLQWGGKDAPFGIKWDAGKPETAYYLCEHNACVIKNQSLMDMQHRGEWRCHKSDYRTKNGLDFYDSNGNPLRTPDSVTFSVWTAYSPFTTWRTIVEDFYKAKDDIDKLKTFTNTTLGEAWEIERGEKLDWQDVGRRRENYGAQLPEWVVYLTAGVDTQDDRYEGRVWGWGAGQESALIDRFILHGDPSSETLKTKVREKLQAHYQNAAGLKLPIGIICWDSGGHYTDDVYDMSKKIGVMRVIPIKGANVYGKPIANFPRKRNAKGVYLTEVGTDNAKELIMARLKIMPDQYQRVPGAVHLPANIDVCDDDELKQLTAERKVPRRESGKVVYRWDAGKRRNEALDCYVYALAAINIAISRFGIDLEKLSKTLIATGESDSDDVPPAPVVQTAKPKNTWIQNSGGWL